MSYTVKYRVQNACAFRAVVEPVVDVVMNVGQENDGPAILWIVIGTIAVHFIEEYALNFPGWTLQRFSVPLSFEDFHLVNACVSLYAIACAVVGWRLPSFSLSIAALVGLNGLFHAGGALLSGGYAPGAVTGAVLFVPVAVASYRHAHRASVLSTRALVVSLSLGVLWHVFLGATFYLKYFGAVAP